MKAAQAQCLGQLGTIVLLAALDFHHLCHELPAPAVEVRADGFLLRLEAETGAPLLLGRDAVLGNKLALRRDRPRGYRRHDGG
ncbi:hypothetical protein MAE02_69790 [Microvirga aerophila]|uniref:Uncharacterized protein n=1 Tax=Microvirga aerophila TaxID=670291 RepID=A0A512C4W9_9HYPH|nr:hypothetical protein MAE02_69790 [Microvirga aerophila]